MCIRDSYIPFDILLDAVPKPTDKYAGFPFLIKKYTFSYCHSSTLLHSLQHKNHATTPSPQLLSFAPSFHNLDKNYDELLVSRARLDELVHSLPEIETINNLMNCEMRTGKEASKKTFLDMASDYQFLHLATHGKMDDKNAGFSFVAFSNMVDTLKESYKLFTNELNTLRLNADMVVLSACETGIGAVYKGEGIISLSRGFLAAGAKSVITTLWSINDKFTSEIVAAFYGNLKKTMGKEEALRQAKLAYLKGSDNFEAHPKYWAAFMPVGDMTPIDEQVFVKEMDKTMYLLLAGGGSVLLGLFFFRRLIK